VTVARERRAPDGDVLAEIKTTCAIFGVACQKAEAAARALGGAETDGGECGCHGSEESDGELPEPIQGTQRGTGSAQSCSCHN
jgi:hypothetical protein